MVETKDFQGNDGEDDVLMNEATSAFIRQHRQDDVRRLAFMADKNPDVDMPFALDQIEGWQTARHKLPSWAAIDGMIYPPHLNMEQCSSEQTARYKAERRGGERSPRILLDLTGGFGVDFSFLSQQFSKAIYVERNPKLCKIAKHNFRLLGLNNVEVINGDGIDFFKSFTSNQSPSLREGRGRSLNSLERFTSNQSPSRTGGARGGYFFIYLDPARRDVNGHKVYNIADCEPDVVALAPQLLSNADKVMIKLSPMFDWREAVRELPCVSEVHIVSVKNECKELLVVLDSKQKDEDKAPIQVHCVNDSSDFTFNFGSNSNPSPSLREGRGRSSEGRGGISFLLVPNASIMKAGCFSELSSRYDITAVGENSHLFFSSHSINDFPGRQFQILSISSMNKKEIKKNLAGIKKANIAVRNFPMTVDALRKRLKIADGGDVYIFATTASDGSHVLIITKKNV